MNRLLIKVDELIQNKQLNEEVFAQIGHSDYTPLNYSHETFLDQGLMSEKISKAGLVICHAGSSSIVCALKAEKPVICVPRRVEFGEHIDNHQLELASALSEKDLLISVGEMDDLLSAIESSRGKNPGRIQFDNSKIIDIIRNSLSEVKES